MVDIKIIVSEIEIKINIPKLWLTNGTSDSGYIEIRTNKDPNKSYIKYYDNVEEYRLELKRRTLLLNIDGIDIADTKEVYEKYKLNEQVGKYIFVNATKGISSIGRYANRGIGALSQVGVDTSGLTQTTMILGGAVEACIAAKSINIVYKQIVDGNKIIQDALAAVETAENIAIQNWPGIAAAATTAAATYSALKYASGEWNFDKDWRSVAGNRAIKNSMAEAV